MRLYGTTSTMKSDFWWLTSGQTYYVQGVEPSILLADGEDIVSLTLLEKRDPGFKVYAILENPRKNRATRVFDVSTKRLLEWEALGEISLASSLWDYLGRCN